MCDISPVIPDILIIFSVFQTTDATTVRFFFYIPTLGVDASNIVRKQG